jgi:hypothetical protein
MAPVTTAITTTAAAMDPRAQATERRGALAGPETRDGGSTARPRSIAASASSAALCCRHSGQTLA